MSRNRLGWSIAVGIGLLAIAAAGWLVRSKSSLTPATEFVRDPLNLSTLTLPVSYESLVPPTSDSDAGEFYQQAMELYLADPDRFEQFVRSARRSHDAQPLLASMELLQRGAACRRMSLFCTSPSLIITYGENPSLGALRALGKAANRLGALLHFEGNPVEAVKHHRAAFALGARLYEQRLTLDQLLCGLELMSEAAAGISAAQGADIDTAPFAEFRKQYLRWYESRVRPTQRIVTSIDPRVQSQHSGDVLYIARRASERMWRVEAILALGRMRFSAPRIGDQRAAYRAIEQFSTDSDPVIRAAAHAARSLTLEQYRMLR